MSYFTLVSLLGSLWLPCNVNGLAAIMRLEQIGGVTCFIWICMLGEEISCDLIHLLRRRLDDAVLDNLNGILKRNPMYKLTAEDIQVISMFDMIGVKLRTG